MVWEKLYTAVAEPWACCRFSTAGASKCQVIKTSTSNWAKPARYVYILQILTPPKKRWTRTPKSHPPKEMLYDIYIYTYISTYIIHYRPMDDPLSLLKPRKTSSPSESTKPYIASPHASLLGLLVTLTSTAPLRPSQSSPRSWQLERGGPTVLRWRRHRAQCVTSPL